MPEAVTTQHETLWIGVNRSAMVRVPYVVSSPEIAGPVQPIDATNLASDMRVYIPGIKDYSGDLAWEANSQRYRPGELRDLLAMDGCHVWAERRMPMVGVRVCIEGEASVSLSAADPDGVQRVTIRIAPSAPMAVEEWSGDTSEGYLYRIRTDANTHMNIQRVDVSYGGRPLSMVVASWTRAQGAANIPHEWDFNGGVGPFGCWYGAFNIDAYVAGTESEGPVCVEAGRLAYRLDPYDLGRTLAGTALVGTYNVMLVVPTVYWKVSSNDLLLSDRARYVSPSASTSGMVPYAHTATLPGGGTRVYPYIGIGVYEASSLGGKLASASGQRPLTTVNYDGFRDRIASVAPASGCGFQMWNFYQWTLFKAMCYAVMGTKNSQWMLGDGPVSGTDKSLTGIGDDAGPYADSTSDYCKLFIENPWGSVWEMIGDAMSDEYVLHAGQSLGGAAIGGQASVGATFPESGGWVGSTSNASASWDVPTALAASDNHGDPAACGDRFTSARGQKCIAVGGVYNHGEVAGLNLVSIFYAASSSNGTLGTRISYFINEYALGMTDEAPAALMSAPLTLSMGQSTPDEEPAEEPEAESAEPTEEPAEEPEENYGEEETPEETDTIEEDMR